MRVMVDPVTRLEGHLSVALTVENGKVQAAECAGTMFRGIEMVLQGRDAFDAVQIVQRICGVCPVSHGIASSLALEQALGIQVTENGRLLRNLILGANYIQSHILHFYHLSALDFVDIAAVIEYDGRDRALVAVRDWVKQEMAGRTINPAAPFLPRYEGDYIADAGVNVGAIGHYLDGLKMRALAHEMLAVFGGKAPHVPALVPGGVTGKVRVDQIEAYRTRLVELQAFIDDAYLPDLIAVARAYPAYATLGKGPGTLLSYGGFPQDASGQSKLLSAGVYRDGTVESLDAELIGQQTASSWFTAASAGAPASAGTVPQPKKDGAYSWVKAPRYGGAVAEVGPLARVMVTHAAGENARLSALLTSALREAGLTMAAMLSPIGRHLARAIECKLVAESCDAWLDALEPGKPGVPASYLPRPAGSGVGMMEAPRGALGHWLSVSDGKIAHYECIVPTTWNCSPRDDQRQPGAVEQALEGVPIADAEAPIEAMRVVRSFDPCLACAVH